MADLHSGVDAIRDLGLDGVFTWFFRLVGILSILAGIGFWLFTSAKISSTPTLLLVDGLFLMALPEVVLGLIDLVA
ncbi:MAG: hypothetical protein ACI9EZ_001100 [Halobacteriales archaeon]|jgi:hypothetical protein